MLWKPLFDRFEQPISPVFFFVRWDICWIRFTIYIPSVVPLPLRKPCCSSKSWLSYHFHIRSKIITTSILLNVESICTIWRCFKQKIRKFWCVVLKKKEKTPILGHFGQKGQFLTVFGQNGQNGEYYQKKCLKHFSHPFQKKVMDGFQE